MAKVEGQELILILSGSAADPARESASSAENIQTRKRAVGKSEMLKTPGR